MANAPRPVILQPLSIYNDRYQELLDTLKSYIIDAGLDISEDSLKKCLDHLLYVSQVNEYINLTRITDLQDALVLHILDSLLLLPSIPIEAHRILDMGTGAGFPGIPLACATDHELVLLDSVGKKINAVNAFIEQLSLDNALAVHARLEDYAKQESGQFDCVCARALASMPVLIEYATPFLNKGGRLIIAKANPDESEIQSGLKAAELCGLALSSSTEFELPNQLGHRMVFSFTSVRAPRVDLPRSAGLAKKTPLA